MKNFDLLNKHIKFKIKNSSLISGILKGEDFEKEHIIIYNENINKITYISKKLITNIDFNEYTNSIFEKEAVLI
jgi:hypothetical protein